MIQRDGKRLETLDDEDEDDEEPFAPQRKTRRISDEGSRYSASGSGGKRATPGFDNITSSQVKTKD